MVWDDVLSKELQAWRPCSVEIELTGGPPRAIGPSQPGRIALGLSCG